MIAKSMLESLFRNMTQSGWDPSGQLLWGYFFTDVSRERLECVRAELVATGYRFVEMWQEEGKNLLWLHVEKVESHTVETLDARNAEFDALAGRFGIASYDGMDVGKPQPRPDHDEAGT